MKFTEIGKLETDRLILRPFIENDCYDMFEYAKNPNVGPNAGWKPHVDIEESKRIITHFMEDKDVLAIVYKENNKVIGSVGLHENRGRRVDNILMLGYIISEDYWGMGLMTECVKSVLDAAFTIMNLDMVFVMHYDFNNRSRRVIEKCGFKYEGRLRRAYTGFDGQVYDELCYSLLREEWSESR